MSEYAYGDTKIHGAACPAKAAGFDVEGPYLAIAEIYDDVVRGRNVEHDEGTIPEDMARDAWSEAKSIAASRVERAEGKVEQAKKNSFDLGQEEQELVYHRDVLGAAKDVQDKIF